MAGIVAQYKCELKHLHNRKYSLKLLSQIGSNDFFDGIFKSKDEIFVLKYYWQLFEGVYWCYRFRHFDSPVRIRFFKGHGSVMADMEFNAICKESNGNEVIITVLKSKNHHPFTFSMKGASDEI